MVQLINTTIQEDNLETGASKVLTVIKPEWSISDCKFSVFTEGITNKLLGCRHKDDVEKKDVILIRVYGQKTDLIIDRDMEIKNMQLMHANGLAKQVYARFNNGIAYGFVAGECLDEKSVREPCIARLIAEEMVRMHSIKPNTGDMDTTPCLFTKLKKYIDLSPDEFPETDRNSRYKKDMKSKKELYEELEYMKSQLEPLSSPIVFSHNDLLLKNIVHSKEDNRTYFIDFEYGAFNYEAYEIGNHFCEYAGIDTVDYNLYPDKEYQMVWLRHFLEAKCKTQGNDVSDVSDSDVERLYVQANKFALMAHFFWGVWGLIQAKYSTIDFDYLDYAVIRMNEYYAKKDQFMALKMP